MGEQSRLTDDFLRHADDEAPKLSKALRKLEPEVLAELGAILRRFDYKERGTLDETERQLARRVLERLHRPSPKGLTLLRTVLDYLDVNENRVLDHAELTLAVEILELFCKADSVNDTLSVKELEMLHAVFRHLDADGAGVLDSSARTHLRDHLWDPNAFLEEQRAENPHLRELLGISD